ncbi:UTP-glucose-1-phosphate uridylyltransferase [Sodalis praecaptivus]|uniref:UTP--glucose-1-phosphate uridylyltransferase n=1 Tax=Sodalis praecaptivus TaxID=1239307 RepID=W0HRT3_9GAMM|nr:sugar phosphate nucleotidyltransferase [Sodalis praecaptivus]AHF76521.1 UTP-glucose-1-phosphate uridylyltransferase [Sodalis praecaptivus]
MKNLKAVIPVAGLGMHLLPATKAIPKEMLPIVDKPMIQYIVDECAAAGVTEIILVTHASKNSVENHFDTTFELEALLESRKKNALLEEVQKICPQGMTVMNVRQGEPLGLGHAVLSAKPIIGDAPFVVVLPDVLLDDSTYDRGSDNLASMIQRYQETGHSQVLVQSLPRDELPNYSVISCNEDVSRPGDAALVQSFIEKPQDISQIDSDLAAVGRYVLSADVWPLLEKTEPGAWGRIQLTDAIAALVNQQPVDAVYLTGRSFNCGLKMGYMQAFVSYGLRNKKLGADFRTGIERLLAK